MRKSASPWRPSRRWRKLGMMGIYFPKEYGGAGGDVLSYAMCRGGAGQGLRHHRRHRFRPHLPVLRPHF